MPRVSAAPTDRTYGLRAGLASVYRLEPSLPPATTTTMPFLQAFSTAKTSGSTLVSCTESVPYDRLITRIGTGPSLRCSTTQLMAAMTWLTSTAPSCAPTLMSISVASGATPVKPVGGRYEAGVPAASRPTMIDARCVPCP